MKIDLRARPFYLDNEAAAWVEHTRDAMTVEDKVGQLFCVLFKQAVPSELEYVLGILKPGGCMYRVVSAERAVSFTQALQGALNIPPLIAANLEKGGCGIVEEGTLLGSPMEVAATDSVDMAVKLAEVCGKEGRAVGANWAFAPIIDIDANFRSPITNTRTFGNDPVRVREMGAAYTRKIQELGLAASIKHFPGDGQDERDQHLVTTINSMDCEAWMETYGAAYRACIEADALTCMVGHIMQPAWSRRLDSRLADRDILPASLSKELMGGLLRGELGFNGLIVTDATTMAGYTIPMSRRLAVPTSIAAGADMFLFARNLEEDYGFMMEGVRSGVITPERLNEAVTRILAVKAALGLHLGKPGPDLEQAKRVVGCEQHLVIGVMTYMFQYSSFGYNRRAIQGNQKLANDSGINIYVNAVLCYTLAGALVAVAGVFDTAYKSNLVPVLGMSSNSTVFAAMFPMAVGIWLSKKANPVIGILAGALAVQLLVIGLSKFTAVGLSSYWQTCLKYACWLVFMIYRMNEDKLMQRKARRKRIALARATRAQRSAAAA